MISVLLILIPLIAGILTFFIKSNSASKQWSVVSSLAVLVITLLGIFVYNKGNYLNYDVNWITTLGSRFTTSMDGMSKLLCLLTAISFPAIFIATYKNEYKNASQFYGLMLLCQAGLMGVFVAADALLFYFFWELALIPIYFLCSTWGGEKRIAATFKFFVYTFLGSLLMLIGIIYLYYKTPHHSFAMTDFYALQLSAKEQGFVFWLFFIAFAIKMPIFPFHTWQPDTYEQSTTAATIVLSAVMVKMGVFAIIRWIVPVLPLAVSHNASIVIILSVTGMLYASFIAIRQDDIKRLIAYSSIAHIGLMCAAIFAMNGIGLKGVMLQMFSHGINVMGLWIVAEAVELKTGTRKFSELGGLAQKMPILAMLFLVMILANVSLPLTSSFVGEFLMLGGLFRYSMYATAVAGICIILVVTYSLNMMRKMFFGNTVSITENVGEATNNVQWVLAVLAIIIIVFGVYPQPLIDLTRDTVLFITGK
ncbi:MAG: NADH-quinone oxidoreductase subunit M [Chitinophagaceae bacterium]|nr:NADH-quinone oxidoreductase subunit M [Chitinophagaceae bacterium]MCW5904391.1 NADH-quinone oxidoreductase subunit M [Chitinophagaceae bacterium]